MRNENLKNELNNIPQDFDREEIWTAIELPKKERKRRRFFWLLASGLMFSGIMFFIILNRGENDQKSQAANNQLIEQSAGSVSSGIQKNKEEPPKSSLSENKKSSPSTKANIVDKSKTSIVKQTIENKERYSIKTPETAISNLRIKNTSAVLESKSSLSPSDYSNNDKSQDANISKSSEESNIISGNRYNSNGENIPPSKLESRKNVILVNPLNLLPPIAFEILENDISKLHLEHEFSALKSYRDKPFLYSFSVFGLIGKSDHDFENSININERQELEKPLESFSIGFLAQRHFQDFEVFTGLAFTQHNTHFTQSVQDYVIIDNIQSLVQREINTQYSLYNSYQYLDLIVGLGYNIPLGRKWYLSPSVQLGYSLSFSAQGEFLSNVNQIVELAGLEEYNQFSKWQGRSNLKITKRMNEKWEIGLLAFLSTRKSIGEFNDYSHLVSSQGIGLSVSRFIK